MEDIDVSLGDLTFIDKVTNSSDEIPDELLDTEVVEDFKVEKPPIVVKKIENPIYLDNEFRTTGISLVDYDDVSPNPNKSELKSILETETPTYITNSPKLNSINDIKSELTKVNIINTELDSIKSDSILLDLNDEPDSINKDDMSNIESTSSLDNSDLELTILEDSGRTLDEMSRKIDSELQFNSQLESKGYLELVKSRNEILLELKSKLNDNQLTRDEFALGITKLRSLSNLHIDNPDERSVIQGILKINGYDNKLDIKGVIKNKLTLEINSMIDVAKKSELMKLTNMSFDEMKLYAGVMYPISINKLIDLCIEKIKRG